MRFPNLTLLVLVWECPVKNALRILCSLLLVALTACGGGGGGSGQSTGSTSAGSGPTLAGLPENVTVYEGQSAVLSVVAEPIKPNGAMTYKWYRNGAEIEGATSEALTIPATSASDTDGIFIVAVTETATNCTTISPPVNLNVNPVILTHPSTTTVAEGLNATFSVTPAAGLTGLTYQWYKNGTLIGGATSATFNTPAVALTDDGVTYKVGVTHLGTTVMSESATLYVDPVITVGPASQNVTAGQSVRFSVATANIPGLRYQWKQNGVNISGATLSSYTKVAALADNGAQLSVAVSNSAGTLIATSANALFTVTPAALTDLVISEVSSCFANNIDCWFEVYNPTSAAINLSAYQVRAPSASAVAQSTPAAFLFTLPSFNVPADGYVVISGNTKNLVQRGTQMLRLRSGNSVPYWRTNGFIEILKNGVTVDFVRFGSATDAPTTAGKWSGAAVSALPSALTSFNISIVRQYPSIETVDTDTAADWTPGDWSTPAGRNDIPVGAVDADLDGVPDSAEVPGGTYAGMDLYAMGARTGRRDIFVHIDAMKSTDAGIIPRAEALQKNVDIFATKNIAVHFDAGIMFSPTFSVAAFNLGKTLPDPAEKYVPYEPCLSIGSTTTCTANTSNRIRVYDWKDEFMDLRRRPIFHYLLFGNSQKADGTTGSGGLAELFGNDVILTLGGGLLRATGGAYTNQVINYQAGTLMHELGHNLGLMHGGNEGLNYKVNYLSIMNYLYQQLGLDADPSGNSAYLRWRVIKSGDKAVGACAVPNSPCNAPSQYIMTYSDGSSANVNEASLLESDNVGRGVAGAYADWDLNGVLTTSPVIKDLSGDGLAVLRDYNDWANLKLVFGRDSSSASGIGNDGTAGASAPVFDAVTDDEQPVVPEEDIPPVILDMLRNGK